eukprot:TRINITY_DN6125_c0_g1_i1.p1 TRINITY_DN6125_c0_g1~~TRINITY_DN6125_c0_g1_i1.p1  ORF type:complete len:376 (-),score=73.90 TRINITY_DN6125_c0_g1_i1:59-1186(-)
MTRITLVNFNKSDFTFHFQPSNLESNTDFTSHQNYKVAKQLLSSVIKGLPIHPPKLLSDGDGGAYLLRDDRGTSVAIFKPMFEEPFSPLNPKRLYSDNPTPSNDLETKRGIRLGEAAAREIAAYSLDYLGFSGVPVTIMVDIDGKQGSLQKFEAHDCESWDFGPSSYDKQQIHKIALLDLRIFNLDRHGGNILVRQSNGKNFLIPIDHGFSLPDVLDGTDLWFEWINWPQAKMPFDKNTKMYVANINVGRDTEVLRSLGIRKECVRNMVIATLVLKKGVDGGMNLYQIAQMYLRKVTGKKQQHSSPSLVEKIAEKVPDIDSPDFLDILSGVVNEEVGKIADDKKKLTTSFVHIIENDSAKREDLLRGRNQLRTSA